MKEEALFYECQKFNQWWIWLIMVLVLLFLAAVFVMFPSESMLVLLLLGIGLVYLFRKVKLETAVKAGGIYVRFFPLHIMYQFHPWESIEKVYIRKYSAISEFGGWGIREGFIAGKAYNVDGDEGLQIEFNSKEKLLIGTRKPDELRAVLARLNQGEEKIQEPKKNTAE